MGISRNRSVKVIDLVQFVGPEWMVNSTVLEMWLGLGISPKSVTARKWLVGIGRRPLAVDLKPSPSRE